MHIETDDLSRSEVHALLQEHLDNMHALSPAEHVFVLDVEKLKAPSITFWTVWDDGLLIGCGALKELSPTHGEIKSMRTPQNLRRRGAGRAVLEKIIETAKMRGYSRLSLETGSHPDFKKSRNLYESLGFEYSGPFADYRENPRSVFMSLDLPSSARGRL